MHRQTAYKEAAQENLLDELTRLVGRPMPVVREALARLLGVFSGEVEAGTARSLSPYPMTAWKALAPETAVAEQSWMAIASAGLQPEEVFTAMAVIDDHVRRYYGNDAWSRAGEWSCRLARRHGLEVATVRPSSSPLARVRAALL